MFIILEARRPVARKMQSLEGAMRRVSELVVQARPPLPQKLGRLAEVEERRAEVLGRELLDVDSALIFVVGGRPANVNRRLISRFGFTWSAS